MVVVGESIRESHLESQRARKRLRTILARHSDSRAGFASSKEMERIVEVFSGYGGQKKLPEEALRVLA